MRLRFQLQLTCILIIESQATSPVRIGFRRRRSSRGLRPGIRRVRSRLGLGHLCPGLRRYCSRFRRCHARLLRLATGRATECRTIVVPVEEISLLLLLLLVLNAIVIQRAISVLGRVAAPAVRAAVERPPSILANRAITPAAAVIRPAFLLRRGFWACAVVAAAFRPWLGLGLGLASGPGPGLASGPGPGLELGGRGEWVEGEEAHRRNPSGRQSSPGRRGPGPPTPAHERRVRVRVSPPIPAHRKGWG